MRREATLVVLAGLLFAATVHAEEPPIVVLEPENLGAEQRPEGTRAVIAELSASGFRVLPGPRGWLRLRTTTTAAGRNTRKRKRPSSLC
jgi:hypothetical protein